MRRFGRSRFAAVAAIFGAAVLVLAGPTARAGAADPPAEARVTDFVNSLRSGAGLAPLASNDALTGMARGWTDHMVAAGGLSHNPALTTAAPAGWQSVGENVGMGSNVDAVDQALAASPVHRANMLGSY